MAVISEMMLLRVKQAIDIIARRSRVRGAFLFGSHVEGTPDEDSDIDVAAFIEEAERLDIQQRAQAAADVQLEIGSDIELHIFSAKLLKNPPAASFAAYIQRHGMRIEV